MEQKSRAEMWHQAVGVFGSEGSDGTSYNGPSKDDGHKGKRFQISPRVGVREHRNGLMEAFTS